MKEHVELGIERLISEEIDLLKGLKVGLVCNQASVDHNFHHAADRLSGAADLKALFGPQHGIRGDVQDNMVETDHSVDRKTGLPVYSLYSETRIPTDEMFADLDAIVVDLQDVGCRIYTFVYTMANCMRVAAKSGKKVIVCDRPNPITGLYTGGNMLEAGWESFVGQAPLPTRHGLTIGELAAFFDVHFQIGCDLTVVEMRGWEREFWIDETDAPWVLPSPNMPTLDTAAVFPGTVHLEGTQLSEGRGTTRPFELIGAPYIDAFDYADALNGLKLDGVYFRAAGFQPTFQKHAGKPCGGVQIHVLDRKLFEPVTCGVATVKVAHDLYGDFFKWKLPPYEYVYDKNPFDVIAGTDKLRKQIESATPLTEIVQSWREGLEAFEVVKKEYHLY